ncbi:TrmH family RNA methyltransferase [Schlesneria sp. DSM 10557]|uniref:TrmH family RNA methyltransferase n=1 Tax=Schlesneria sp. DSM 10557 TaxID=3044399 RepID=UPI0035A0AC22
MRSRELVICGLNAVRSRFETASSTVKRLFFTLPIAPEIGDLCRWMAKERLVYRCVEPEELERISGSIHHGGVVVVVQPPEIRSPRLDEVRQWASSGLPLLILDRVSNVHNLGAIIRTAAFFGVTKLIIPDHPQAALPTEATYRVAEGGLDHVEVFCVDHLPGFLRAIRPYYFIVGAATRGGSPTKGRNQERPYAIVLGNEELGLDRDVMSACHELTTIPGSGFVESLNVSVTAAILLWELIRSPERPDTPRFPNGPISAR